jgi:hypothetical protein
VTNSSASAVTATPAATPAMSLGFAASE